MLLRIPKPTHHGCKKSQPSLILFSLRNTPQSPAFGCSIIRLYKTQEYDSKNSPQPTQPEIWGFPEGRQSERISQILERVAFWGLMVLPASLSLTPLKGYDSWTYMKEMVSVCCSVTHYRPNEWTSCSNSPAGWFRANNHGYHPTQLTSKMTSFSPTKWLLLLQGTSSHIPCCKTSVFSLKLPCFPRTLSS